MEKPRAMKLHLAPAFVCCVLLFSGCQGGAGSTAQVQELESRVSSLEKRFDDLAKSEAKVSVAISSSATPAPSPVETTSASSSLAPVSVATPAQSSLLWQTLKYDSLPSPEILKRAVSLGFLPKAGISTQEGFEGEITRGQYLAMLVEMNNLMCGDAGAIRLAQDGDGQAFTDVPSSHPYYSYIQGMVDGGYVIGFDEKSFQPDKQLTREEMVAIVAKRDYTFEDFDKKYFWDNYAPFTDKNDIAPKYRDAITKDSSHGSGSHLNYAFGEAKLFRPKKNVKAYEALLSLQSLGGFGEITFNSITDKTTRN